MKQYDKLKFISIIDSVVRALELEIRFSNNDIFKKQCIDIISDLYSLRLSFILLKLEE